MRIWVDADALPKVIRDILFRAAQRTGVDLTLVANQPLQTPAAANIQSRQVSAGYDEADNYIAGLAEEGDLVITADIPLAAEVIENGALALNPRGEMYTRETIRSRLNMRDFMDTMRSSGIEMSTTPALSQTDRQRFANSLDRWLAKRAAQEKR
ncbi:MAG: YaiI/YqxD family protein [Halieaceae bacterium]|nr:YaiI/YqxD family protein [Halieaceae bacterium]